MKIHNRTFWRLAAAAPIGDRAYYRLLDWLSPDHLPGWRPLHLRHPEHITVPRPSRRERRQPSGRAVR